MSLGLGLVRGVRPSQCLALPPGVTPGSHKPLQDSASQEPQPGGHLRINRHTTEVQVGVGQEQKTSAGRSHAANSDDKAITDYGPASQQSALRGMSLSPRRGKEPEPREGQRGTPGRGQDWAPGI